MNIPMLKKVRAAILKRPRQFEMRKLFNDHLVIHGKHLKPSHCGTAACIAGWVVHLDSGYKRLKTTREKTSSVWTEAESILEIDSDQTWRLFYVSYWPDQFRVRYNATNATPASRAEAAAERIGWFIKTKGRE